MKLKALLITVFILIYNYEISSNINIRPFDSFLPWDRIRPLEIERYYELKKIAYWINNNSKDKDVILSKYDAIRFFSYRPLLGGNDWPQKLDLLEEWYKYSVIYDNFLKGKEMDYLNLFRSKNITYVVIHIKDVDIENVDKLNVVFKTKNFLVHKIKYF